ncbi:4-hydroxythreonine-4-phosphate dehydrogenase PdxA [Gemmatimonadota bacterium]
MDRSRRLLFTPGDPAGIGPEVILKAVSILRRSDPREITLVGPETLWNMAADRLDLVPPSDLNVEIVTPGPDGEGDLSAEILFSGRTSIEGAQLALSCLETAAGILESSPHSTAVVTGPVNKQGLHDAGFDMPGQTEWFARRFEVKSPVMLLVGGRLRVALLSTHMPLTEVASALTREGIVGCLRILVDGLSQRFGIDSPQIAMLALNPHGGSDGERGAEERDILEPAIESAGESGIRVSGPFSADAFFGRRQWETFDAVVAPYHDQGLIPVKMEAAGRGVNVTLGLPVVRTSPDHGTAFDIAGTGSASENATVEAALLAERLLMGRGAETAD